MNDPDETVGSSSIGFTFESGVVPAQGSGAPPSLPHRYLDLGAVASGAFGEVRRVRDTVFDRVLAVKVLRAEVSRAPAVRRRFFTEVQITAQLQHPGVVPVYDHGELPDGRLWYAMKEVRGTTFSALIREVHAVDSVDLGATIASGRSFRRVADAFARVALTVAYAHGQGILHRDLKPDNVMVGEHGEAYVMDWGLARRATVAGASDEEATDDDLVISGDALTQQGVVLGTPAYMPPEQAMGARELHGPHSDVYALGAILYHLLAGRPPYEGTGASAGRSIVERICKGPPPPLRDVSRKAPRDLERACERAMQRRAEERGSASALANDVLAWLDGVRRAEQAREVLRGASPIAAEIALRREEAARAREASKALFGALKPYDTVDAKRPAWALEDKANELRLAAVLAETRWLEAVHGALSIEPELPEAHALLADHYAASLIEAERTHRDEDAARLHEMIRVHARGRRKELLRGEGALTFTTDPPGARVALYRHVSIDRRLVPVFDRDLGRTPIVRARLPRGRYTLVASVEGRMDVRCPIIIEREGHWDGVPPGESDPLPIVLPSEGELGPEDVYVPAGYAWIGGDAEAPDSLPSRRVWVDAFVVRRHPVTCGEYLEFLDDLAASGRIKEALAACPHKEMGWVEGSDEHLAWSFDEGGRFSAPRGDPAWQRDMPVVQVDWHAAMAYAAWLSARTGERFRLLDEVEREKAARGADGRLFPWGDYGDPTFACVLEGHRAEPLREGVSGHPADESPYGARGLAGNVRDWCINVWRPEGPLIEEGRLTIVPAPLDDPDFRAVRGGFWGGPLVNGRSAGRFGSRPGLRRFSVGVRVGRSYGE